MLEIIQAAVSVWGEGKVGVRISPSSTYGSMHDSDLQTTFGYLAGKLNDVGLTYLHVVEPRIKGTETVDEHAGPVAVEYLRKIFYGPIIAAGGFSGATAEALLAMLQEGIQLTIGGVMWLLRGKGKELLAPLNCATVFAHCL